MEEDKKLELEYYKNNIIHFFITHSLFAVSLLTGTEEVKDLETIRDDYDFLKWLFSREFVFEEKEDSGETLAPILGCFVDFSYVVDAGESGGYKVTKLGLDKLPIWAALAKTYLESYWVATRSLNHQYKKDGKRGDILKNMDDLGKRFHSQGIIEHIGALSQLNFKNAAGFFQETVLKTRSSSKQPDLETLSQVSQRLYELSHYRS